MSLIDDIVDTGPPDANPDTTNDDNDTDIASQILRHEASTAVAQAAVNLAASDLEQQQGAVQTANQAAFDAKNDQATAKQAVDAAKAARAAVPRTDVPRRLQADQVVMAAEGALADAKAVAERAKAVKCAADASQGLARTRLVQAQRSFKAAREELERWRKRQAKQQKAAEKQQQQQQQQQAKAQAQAQAKDADLMRNGDPCPACRHTGNRMFGRNTKGAQRVQCACFALDTKRTKLCKLFCAQCNQVKDIAEASDEATRKTLCDLSHCSMCHCPCLFDGTWQQFNPESKATVYKNHLDNMNVVQMAACPAGPTRGALARAALLSDRDINTLAAGGTSFVLAGSAASGLAPGRAPDAYNRAAHHKPGALTTEGTLFAGDPVNQEAARAFSAAVGKDGAGTAAQAYIAAQQQARGGNTAPSTGLGERDLLQQIRATNPPKPRGRAAAAAAAAAGQLPPQQQHQPVAPPQQQQPAVMQQQDVHQQPPPAPPPTQAPQQQQQQQQPQWPAASGGGPMCQARAYGQGANDPQSWQGWDFSGLQPPVRPNTDEDAVEVDLGAFLKGHSLDDCLTAGEGAGAAAGGLYPGPPMGYSGLGLRVGNVGLGPGPGGNVGLGPGPGGNLGLGRGPGGNTGLGPGPGGAGVGGVDLCSSLGLPLLGDMGSADLGSGMLSGSIFGSGSVFGSGSIPDLQQTTQEAAFTLSMLTGVDPQQASQALAAADGDWANAEAICAAMRPGSPQLQVPAAAPALGLAAAAGNAPAPAPAGVHAAAHAAAAVPVATTAPSASAAPVTIPSTTIDSSDVGSGIEITSCVNTGVEFVPDARGGTSGVKHGRNTSGTTDRNRAKKQLWYDAGAGRSPSVHHIPTCAPEHHPDGARRGRPRALEGAFGRDGESSLPSGQPEKEQQQQQQLQQQQLQHEQPHPPPQGLAGVSSTAAAARGGIKPGLIQRAAALLGEYTEVARSRSGTVFSPTEVATVMEDCGVTTAGSVAALEPADLRDLVPCIRRSHLNLVREKLLKEGYLDED